MVDHATYRNDRVFVQFRESKTRGRLGAPRGVRSFAPTTARQPDVLARLVAEGVITGMDEPKAALRGLRARSGVLGVARAQAPRPPAASKVETLLNQVKVLHLAAGQDARDVISRLRKEGGPSMRVERVPLRRLVAARRKSSLLPKEPWNLAAIRWKEARSARGFKDATKIHVAVLDTGLDFGHPEFRGLKVKEMHRYPGLSNVVSDRDIVGHGTHVAGIIAADLKKPSGFRGLCTCKLTGCKIFGDEPYLISKKEGFHYVVEEALYLAALAWCAESGVSVINLSIGTDAEPTTEELFLFKLLAGEGCHIVAAMGNEREWGSPTSYPAAIPGVIAVGSTAEGDTISEFSNSGKHIALAAPGSEIWSTVPTYPGISFHEFDPKKKSRPGKGIPRETRYACWSGTSMASPHVAAAVALLLAQNPKLTAKAVRQRLEKSARPPKGSKRKFPNKDFGAGILDLQALLQRPSP